MDDAQRLRTCEDGQWKEVSCLEQGGSLCEAGACVLASTYGQPTWSTCADEPRATSESLLQKAQTYDEITARLHVHPQLKWAMGVDLKAGADPQTATWQDVETWLSGENDGLWSSIYLASQAYRYAVTQDQEALQMVLLLMEGELARVRVTGVPGLFTRQFIPPGIEGLSCPTDDAAYTTDEEKDDNRWVQVRDDGCVWVVDRISGAWTKTEHCGNEQFAGYCWLDNVSKDEYSGHMFALGIVLQLVQDEAVQSIAKTLLAEVGEHLVRTNLRVTDWDGRVTEHGRMHPLALDNFPGFNAAMSLGYLQLSMAATGDASLAQLYDDCVLMKGGAKDCFEVGFIEILPFTRYLDEPGLYIGDEGCRSNFNNISMHLLSMHTLLTHTSDPDRRAFYQRSLDVDVMRVDAEPRTATVQNNALFNFIWAANKALGPGADGPAFDAVENAVCMLRQFPASQNVVEVIPQQRFTEPYCKNRFDRDTGEFAREVADRCVTNIMWWKDPYDLGACGAVPGRVEVPSDYLLAYWMGRYYGFISPEL